MVLLGQIGQRTARICDGDEVISSLIRSHHLDSTVVKKLEERERLHRTTRFGRDDEEGLGYVKFFSVM